MRTDVGIGHWVVMTLMLLLMAVVVVLVGWLLMAPLWERLQRRAAIRRSRLRAATRSARFERKQSSGSSRAVGRRR